MWFPVAIFIAIGCLWAIASNNWDNFARMGSAVVILSLATYFGSLEKSIRSGLKDLEGKIGELAERIMDESIQVNFGRNDLSEDGRKVATRAGQKFTVQFGKFGVHVANMDSKAVDKYFSRNALAIAVLGTLIWGFGDLIPDILNFMP